jgi:hypothetical protein
MAQTTLLLSLLFCGTALSSTALALDNQLVNLVMPDAKILAGINATNVESSAFGQFIVSKVGSGGHLQQFTEATGFNPLQDVTEVLAATAADPANPGGLLLVRGNFDPVKISSLVSSKPNVQVQNLTGTPAITLVSVTNPNQKVAHAVAFIGNTIAVAGDLPSVQAALNRINSGSTIDSTLLNQASQLSGSEDEWVVSITSLASLAPQKPAPQKPATGSTANPGLQSQVLPVLKNVQSFNGGVKFGDTVQFTGEAVSTDANNANSLAAVIKLAEIMISSNASAANDPRGADFIQILQGLQVTTNGPAVDVSLAVPESQLEAMLNTPASHARPAFRGNRKNGGNPGN